MASNLSVLVDRNSNGRGGCEAGLASRDTNLSAGHVDCD
jgi:hypothetical protein